MNFAGDPFSGIYFVQENCSLDGLDKAIRAAGLQIGTHPTGPPWGDPRWLDTRWGNIQWGDGGLTRDRLNPALKRNCFRDKASGDLRCYFTNVMKTIVEVKKWKNQENKMDAAEIWADVLQWELDTGQPRMVVASGTSIARYLGHLVKKGLLRGYPRPKRIIHSSAQPEEVAEFHRQMDEMQRESGRVVVEIFHSACRLGKEAREFHQQMDNIRREFDRVGAGNG